MKIKSIYITRGAKFLVFIFLVTGLDYLFGSIFQSLYFHQKSGQQSNMTYVLTKCKADVLIFGNSRAQHHYNTKIIEDSIKPLTCFNSGFDGGHSNLLFYALIKEILNRYHPKFIILEFDPTSVVYDQKHYDLLSVLLPYQSIYPEMNSIIGLRSPFESVKLCSRIYPFNSNIIDLIRNNHIESAQNINGGYIPLHRTMDITQLPDTSEAMADLAKIDPWKIKALENTIQLCNKNNVKLIIINSPVFHTGYQSKEKFYKITQITERYFSRYKTNYIDFYDNPLFLSHPQWFQDKGHLNSDGADVFSGMVGGMIHSMVKNNSEP